MQEQNPFADLIPNNSVSSQAAEENPFMDLIPQKKQSGFDKTLDYINYLGDSAGKGARHAISAPAETLINPLIDAGLGTHLTKDLQNYNRAKDEAYNQKYPDAGIGGKTLSNLYEGIPSFAFGGVGATAPNVMKASAKAIPNIMKGLAESSLKGAAIGAGSAPLFYDETHELSPLQKTIQGGELGAWLAPALSGTGIVAKNTKQGLASMLNPLSKAKGINSPAEIEAIRQAAGNDIPMLAGNVIEDPGLRNFQQNALGKKTQEIYQDIYAGLQNRAGNIEEGLSANNSGDIGAQIQDALKNKYRNVIKIKDNLYKEAGKIAQENNLEFIPKNTNAKADEIIQHFEDKFENLPSSRGDYEDFLTRIKDFAKYKPTSYKKAEEDRQFFSTIFKKADAKSNFSLSKEEKTKIGELREAFDKDLIESAKPIPGAHDAFKYATEFYKREVVPFEAPKTSEGKLLKKHAVKDLGNPDKLISEFISPGNTNDDANKLKVLIDHLSPEKRDSLIYGFLNQHKSENRNPIQNMVNAYKKLGAKQRDVLFEHNPEIRKQLDDLSLLVKANPEAMGIRNNPKTGYQASKQIGSKMLPFGMGAVAEGVLHHKAGLATAGLSYLLKHAANRAKLQNLISPSALDEYVSRVTGLKQKQNAYRMSPILGGLISAINEGR